MFNEILLISLLYVVSFLLLFVEIAIIPGFGITGVAGIGVLILGCIATWMFFGPISGIISLLLGLTVSILSVYLAFTSKSGKKFILESKVGGNEGVKEGFHIDKSLIGKKGVVVSPLRPSGIIEIANERFDVISEGDFINSGEGVLITGIRSNYLVVERIAVTQQ